eukprot:scaffold12626_cov62-Phaeocystis_antarctica.AAC.5
MMWCTMNVHVHVHVMHHVMHYSRKGHLVVLVALGTNDAVLVNWGVDDGTLIQPDLRQVASRAHQAICVRRPTVWRSVPVVMLNHDATLEAAAAQALHPRTDGKARTGRADALDARFSSPHERLPLVWALKARVNQLRRLQDQAAVLRAPIPGARRSPHRRIWLHAPSEILWQPRDAPACVSIGRGSLLPHRASVRRALRLELVHTASTLSRRQDFHDQHLWRWAQLNALELLNCDPPVRRPGGWVRLPHLCCWFARQGELWRC